jgi:hypothetical protein
MNGDTIGDLRYQINGGVLLYKEGIYIYEKFPLKSTIM